ncbi:MAG: hypothetical protein HRK26_01290 [Rickettsiaceae bacterium H1]|nr:hypothetical protein [Rickettsiaceae bacterium H1]
MRKAFLHILTFLFSVIPIKFAFAVLLLFLFFIRQSVEKPEIMEGWQGFFARQIQVNSNTLGGGTSILAANDCAFVAPTRVKAYKACCDENEVKTSDQEVYENNELIECENGSSLCVCAKRVLVDCETNLYPNPELGCVAIPLPPPPPPFYDVFRQSPEVRIVPVQDSSFFNPKIKVMVGLGDQKKCNNGDLITLSASCLDGSEGILSGYVTQILQLNLDGTSRGMKELIYNGKFYIFEAQKRSNQICGLYYGNSYKVGQPISSVCYDIPKAIKPKIINSPANIQTLLDNGEEIAVSIGVNGYNNNLPFDLYYNKKGFLHNDTKLRLRRLKMGNDHFLETELKCYDASGNWVLGNRGKCPSSYMDNIKMDYKEDNRSRVLCVTEEGKKVDQYVLARGNSIFKITELGRAFIPHKYSSAKDKWVVDYSVYPNNLLIEDTNQRQLDKIKNTGANLFSIYSEDRGHYYNAQYKKLESIARLGDLPGDIRGNVNTLHFDENDAQRYNVYDGSSNYTIVKTNFVNSTDKKAFFLTQDEEDNAKYLPLDPYLQGLCITNFPYQDYDVADREEFFDAGFHQCDFVTVEAWGSGAAGYIGTTDPNLSLPQHNLSVSGSSGGYTKGTVKIGNYYRSILKIEIGKGGDVLNKAGEVTKVYLCDHNRNNCNVLLSAQGGQALGKAAEKINMYDVDFFDRDNVLQVEVFPGKEGMYGTIDKPDPDVPQPEILPDNIKGKYVGWENTSCNDSINTTPTVNGMGGCVSRVKGLQPGADGKVRLVCEKWEN